jgi:valyl-tRNA synthetase
MQLLMEVVNAIRTVRGEVRLAPGQRVEARLRVADATQQALLRQHADYLTTLATLQTLQIDAAMQRPEAAATAVVAGIDIYVPLAGLIDFAQEQQRLQKDIQKMQQELQHTAKKLGNAQFLERAPADIVAKERTAQAERQDKLQRLQAAMARLEQYMHS